MPLYEYDCSGCGEHLEVIQKFSDAPLVSCTKCGGNLVKQLSLTSFQLKGSGWYATDYKKSPSPTSSVSKSETDSSSGVADSSKAEPKKSKE